MKREIDFTKVARSIIALIIIVLAFVASYFLYQTEVNQNTRIEALELSNIPTIIPTVTIEPTVIPTSTPSGVMMPVKKVTVTPVITR